MNTLPVIALVTTGTLFGFAWHDQPCRNEPGESGDDSASNKVGRIDWVLVVIWSFVFLSFAAVFLAGCTVWIKCHGDGLR